MHPRCWGTCSHFGSTQSLQKGRVEGGTQVPDRTLNLLHVFVNFVQQNGQIFARMDIFLMDNGPINYGEILPHLSSSKTDQVKCHLSTLQDPVWGGGGGGQNHRGTYRLIN